MLFLWVQIPICPKPVLPVTSLIDVQLAGVVLSTQALCRREITPIDVLEEKVRLRCLLLVTATLDEVGLDRLEVARQRFFCEGDGYWED